MFLQQLTIFVATHTALLCIHEQTSENNETPQCNTITYMIFIFFLISIRFTITSGFGLCVLTSFLGNWHIRIHYVWIIHIPYIESTFFFFSLFKWISLEEWLHLEEFENFFIDLHYLSIFFKNLLKFSINKTSWSSSPSVKSNIPEKTYPNYSQNLNK